MLIVGLGIGGSHFQPGCRTRNAGRIESSSLIAVLQAINLLAG